MIARHIAMRSLKKSGFAGLMKYLTDPQDKNERVGEITATNCQSAAHEVATIEILNTQSLNQRATSDKTYHLVLSFRAGEQPDSVTLRAIEEHICAGLGFKDHQRISVVHHDTDNLHVHIAINKIHPVRHTIHNPHNDHFVLGKLCDQAERKFGLQSDNHAGRARSGQHAAADMEQHAGVESLIGWIQRECREALLVADSWPALHQAMRDNGLLLHARGNGFVITAADGTTVKASSVDRALSKARLEERLGPFEASPASGPNQQSARRYERMPMASGADTSELFARYKAEQAAADSLRIAQGHSARERKDQLIGAAKRKGRLKRAVIRLLRCDRWSKRILYAATSRTLLAEIEKIHKDYRAERQSVRSEHGRQAWTDWLTSEAARGDDAALDALRKRQGRQTLKGNTLAGEQRRGAGRASVGAKDRIDSITRHGTIILCAGSTVLRDDGERLQVSRTGTGAGLQMALRMAQERYGDCIHIEGTDTFKDQIVRTAAAARLSLTFDDALLERRRQELIAAPERGDDHEHSGRYGTGQAVGGSLPGGRKSAAASRTGARRAEPHAGGVGRRPPPESQNHLRSLSALGMVRIPGGAEVLLPGDVRGHMEQQGTAADHGVRRPVAGAVSPTTQASAAAAQYVFEREQKRLTLSDIPKHKVYDGFQGPASFAGLRKVNGENLALLRSDKEILVLPIDDPTARRLQRLALGRAVIVSRDKGGIRVKGRSR